MDGVTQKFSVFDFFNLLIAGTLFSVVLVICHYPSSAMLIMRVSDLVGDSSFLFFISIILFIIFALIIGMSIQVIGHWIIKEKIGWESKKIATCLSDKELFNNSVRTNRIREKACTYLKLPESNLQLTTEQCSAFFTYCIYYLHVKGLDKKTEKLRETQGLSELFSCVFYLAPLVSIMIFAFQRLFSYDVNLVMQFVVSTCIFCFLMGLIFYKRYKIACRNRIRMVLSIYDACTERENDFSSKNHLNYEIV